MRRRTLISTAAVIAGAAVASGLAAIPATGARAVTLSGSSVSLPVTSYYQMAVDSADGRVFISQGSNGPDSIVVTDFAGQLLGAIAEPTAVEGITLSPDGSALYAALVGSDTVSPAISVISAASLTQTTTYPLPAGDTPQDIAVQSGKLWVSYSTDVFDSYAAIGDFDLSDASPAFETQPAMGGWGTPPLLAADPTGAGNVLVAAPGNDMEPTVAAYDTSADPVTVRAQGTVSDCTGDEYDYVMDVAVAPGGAGFVLACETGHLYTVPPVQENENDLYGTSSLAVQRSYGGIDTPGSVAFASSTGLVAVGDQGNHIVVYTSGGAEKNLFQLDGGLVQRGLGLTADASELFAVTAKAVPGAGYSYSLNIYPDPSVTYPGYVTSPTAIVLTQPAKITVGNPVAVSGYLSVAGLIPAGTSIEVTRTGGGQPASAFTVDVSSAGGFTWTDQPPAAGTYTYTARYAATMWNDASVASVRVTVAKVTPSLSLTVTPTTASYGQAVTFNAHLANMAAKPSNRTVTVYAQQAGSTTRTVIASGPVNASGNIGGTAHFTKSTSISAVYSGDTDNAAVTVTKAVNVYAKVTAAIGGYYGTKSGYRLYHHTARLNLSAAVAPNKKGECVQFQVQQYVRKAWRAVMTTGCATLNSKSQAGGSLSVSRYALGVPYRVRAVYVRGKDATNLAAVSGFLYFLVEK
jgi:hypothetical protein